MSSFLLALADEIKEYEVFYSLHYTWINKVMRLLTCRYQVSHFPYQFIVVLGISVLATATVSYLYIKKCWECSILESKLAGLMFVYEGERRGKKGSKEAKNVDMDVRSHDKMVTYWEEDMGEENEPAKSPVRSKFEDELLGNIHTAGEWICNQY
jgi:hypothetical protein